MNSFTYIIIDDEPKAIKLLQSTINRNYDNLHLQSSYTSAEEAIPLLKMDTADLLFVDITMPHTDGLTLMEKLHGISAEVIFVTAHEEYAFKAFSFTPAGYILKPINETKLTDAIDKALQRVCDKKLNRNQKNEHISNSVKKIGLRNNKGIDYVNVDDIYYMEATSRCTKVVTGDKVYLSSYNLGKLKQLIESYNFYPVHRSFLVNINKIKRYESSGIIITDRGYEIPVSKSERESFLALFKKL